KNRPPARCNVVCGTHPGISAGPAPSHLSLGWTLSAHRACVWAKTKDLLVKCPSCGEVHEISVRDACLNGAVDVVGQPDRQRVRRKRKPGSHRPPSSTPKPCTIRIR